MSLTETSLDTQHMLLPLKGVGAGIVPGELSESTFIGDSADFDPVAHPDDALIGSMDKEQVAQVLRACEAQATALRAGLITDAEYSQPDTMSRLMRRQAQLNGSTLIPDEHLSMLEVELDYLERNVADMQLVRRSAVMYDVLDVLTTTYLRRSNNPFFTHSQRMAYYGKGGDYRQRAQWLAANVATHYMDEDGMPGNYNITEDSISAASLRDVMFVVSSGIIPQEQGVRLVEAIDKTFDVAHMPPVAVEQAIMAAMHYGRGGLAARWSKPFTENTEAAPAVPGRTARIRWVAPRLGAVVA